MNAKYSSVLVLVISCRGDTAFHGRYIADVHACKYGTMSAIGRVVYAMPFQSSEQLSIQYVSSDNLKSMCVGITVPYTKNKGRQP